MKKKIGGARKKWEPSEEILENVLKMRVAGHTYREIGKQVGISHTVIYQYFKKRSWLARFLAMFK